MNEALESTSIVWTRTEFDELINLAHAKKRFGTYQTSTDFYLLLQRFKLRNVKVLVAGSIHPWLESIIYAHGIRDIYTSEYAHITDLSNRVKVLHVSEVQQERYKSAFDVIFSYSSVEHDGLGRFGDPINPCGDVAAVNELRGALKPGGLLMLGVPVGRDALVNNWHRVYGPIRIPLLFDGFELLGAIANQQFYDSKNIYNSWPFATQLSDPEFGQAIFILRKS
jgi:SAM-dependent methyltransferase